jgi:hypothetical protein
MGGGAEDGAGDVNRETCGMNPAASQVEKLTVSTVGVELVLSF